MELHYDPKLGFILLSVTMFSSGFYYCHAEYYEKKSHATYNIFIKCKDILVLFCIYLTCLICLNAFGFRVYFSYKHVCVYVTLKKKKKNYIHISDYWEFRVWSENRIYT